MLDCCPFFAIENLAYVVPGSVLSFAITFSSFILIKELNSVSLSGFYNISVLSLGMP